MNTIFKSPVCEIKELKDLFIEMTAKNCNSRCKQCYIDFPFTKNIKDFIKPDVVKQALTDLKEEKIRCIYLTGAEPMTHPDFNLILRLCLKKSNVCIITNASLINEKKARFLKNVENESNYQIIFKISFAHYDEIKNDGVRARGSYRQNFYALKCLDKYEFTNIICVSNYYK
ncbi:MAG: radical SAM protein, partial [Cyanobacteria bacterium RUI128]|nr:radical SAM protein [Cyanobacteria bacterium RUI128]